MTTVSTMLEKRQQMAKQKRAEIASSSGRQDDAVKPEVGLSKWRILPSWRGSEDPDVAHSFGQHFIKDQNGDVKVVHVCLDKTYSKPCPICEALTTAILRSNDETQRVLSESQAGGVFLMNAIRVDAKGDKNKVVLLQLTPGLFDKILDIADQYAESGIDLFDIKSGYDLGITRQGTGLKTKYSVTPSPVPTAINKAVLENLIDLDKYVGGKYAANQKSNLQSVALAAVGLLSGISSAPNPGQKALENDDVPFFSSDDDGVIDADFEEVVAPPKAKAKQTKAVPVPPPAADPDDLDDLFDDLDDLDLE